ncbi:MAG: family 43 glycosylhydrolase [Saprospiraceae bacterium]
MDNHRARAPKTISCRVFQCARHGDGCWAPCIRYHNEHFYIYWGDPDFGIYMVKASNPAGPWTEPVLVLEGKGLIDPSPLWDDDGKVWLVHSWAGSRKGKQSAHGKSNYPQMAVKPG